MKRLTREVWANVLFSVCIVLTVATGFVVGYGAVWFQLFGDTADAEDYQVSAGGYGAAAAVLLLAVLAVLAFRRPRWLAFGAAGVAALYTLLALRSAQLAGDVDDRGPGLDSAWDGIGGVALMPWSLVLVVLGTLGVARLVRRSR
jgi:hypothetical protein